MASNQGVKIEDLITCVICKELFDDPRLMPCSHTYCYKCIKHIASGDGQFECSHRDNCKILQHDIDTLPLNQDMCGLVELYRKQQNNNGENL
jgi:hypothetical protein